MKKNDSTKKAPLEVPDRQQPQKKKPVKNDGDNSSHVPDKDKPMKKGPKKKLPGKNNGKKKIVKK